MAQGLTENIYSDGLGKSVDQMRRKQDNYV